MSERALLVSKASQAKWVTGRVGMLYRDLVEGGLGGKFVVSTIKIVGDGPVGDYVHFHRVRFQMIYCRRGWVRVVYEDQGEPFVLRAGDAVIQPPEIRHRVLESGDGLEVVELATPAQHETCADEEMDLPTPEVRAGRLWSGQRFVRHVAASATWQAREGGFEARDLGYRDASGGVAGACVLRGRGRVAWKHEKELVFAYVLDGALRVEGVEVGADDAFVVPAGREIVMEGEGEVLEVCLPG